MFERFTDRARTVVKQAQTEAANLGHRYIGTEHLLLAMLESGGIAQEVLNEAGITHSRVRDGVKQALQSDAEALESIGIDLDAVKAKLEETFGPGVLDTPPPPQRKGWLRRTKGEGKPMGHKPFTPRSKKVLELSLREALGLKQNFIGTEHILLGLLREGKGLAAKILADAGVDFNDLRDKAVTLSRRR